MSQPVPAEDTRGVPEMPGRGTVVDTASPTVAPGRRTIVLELKGVQWASQKQTVEAVLARHEGRIRCSSSQKLTRWPPHHAGLKRREAGCPGRIRLRARPRIGPLQPGHPDNLLLVEGVVLQQRMGQDVELVAVGPQ